MASHQVSMGDRLVEGEWSREQLQQQLERIITLLYNEEEIRAKGIVGCLRDAQSEFGTVKAQINKSNSGEFAELTRKVEARILELEREEARLRQFLAANWDTESIKTDTLSPKPLTSKTNKQAMATSSPADSATQTFLGLRQRKTRDKREFNISSGSNTNDEQKRQLHQQYRHEHDEITSDMIQMARRLKQNNLALQSLVESDKQVVDEAGGLMHSNTGRFATQHQELSKFSSKSWATTWKLLMLGLMVLGTVLFIFMLILISSKR